MDRKEICSLVCGPPGPVVKLRFALPTYWLMEQMYVKQQMRRQHLGPAFFIIKLKWVPWEAGMGTDCCCLEDFKGMRGRCGRRGHVSEAPNPQAGLIS